MPEAGAFRFAVRGGLALLPAIVVGAFVGVRPALAVALLGIVAAGAWTLVRRRAAPRIRTAPRHLGPPDELRLLVVANDTLGDERLADVVTRATRGAQARVLLLAPLEPGALHRWTSDTDDAQAALAQRVADAARALNVPVETCVAADEPLQAIEDSLAAFGADEVLVVTHGPRSELAAQAYGRFAVPVSHVVL